jgi:hypothetical protein
VFIPAITKQACQSRYRTGDQDHLLVETAMVCQSGVAASRRNQQGLVSRIEYARAMAAARSGE